MKKLAILTLVTLLFPLISPIGESFYLTKKYTYDSEEQVQNLHFVDIIEPTANIKHNKSTVFWKQASGKVTFSQKQNMFVLRIPRTFTLDTENTLRINIQVDGKKIPLSIDTDGDGRNEAFYYTEPVFFDKTNHITYTIETKLGIQIPSLSIIGLDTNSSNLHMAFGVIEAQASGENLNINIIKRADWGADETLRYRNHSRWQTIFTKLEAEKDKPKSEATLTYEAKNLAIATHLATDFPEQDQAIERIKEENGHELVWPIEKTKQVERIIIHHTAEDNQKNRDDLTLIRGIYYYHTIVRGWGDIGYNYLVGQRGQIYEGRAGGDYNVAAHALWNNKSTVGVSVMGNFMTDSIVTEQEEVIKDIIEYLSKKYGIDIHGNSIGHKECLKNSCLIDDFSTPNLEGHREVGFTNCPGNNLFRLVENIRKMETTSIGRNPVINPKYNSIKLASLVPFLGLGK